MVEPSSHNKNPSSSGSGKPNPFFPMVLFSATVFILTVLAMVAVIFSDPRAPIAQFLDAHAGRLIGAEVVVTLILGLCALVVDRMQSRRSGSVTQSADEQPIHRSKKSNQD